jgi:hypothetical protein
MRGPLGMGLPLQAYMYIGLEYFTPGGHWNGTGEPRSRRGNSVQYLRSREYLLPRGPILEKTGSPGIRIQGYDR